MSFENYTIRARCFRSQTEFTRETMNRLNRLLDDLMRDRGYLFESGDPRDLLWGEQAMATMRFGRAFHYGKQPLLSKIRKSYDEWSQEKYFKILRNMVDSAPFELLFRIDYGTLSSGSKGFLIDVESQPTIIAKIRQLHIKDLDDPIRYDNILYENKRAVVEIISALGAKVLEEPSVVKQREWIKRTPLIDDSLVESLPEDVARCLREANSCHVSGNSHACSVMIRKAIEVAASKKLTQEGRGDRLYDKDGHEVGLGKKLDLLADVVPGVSRSLDEVKRLKWLGDVSAHDPRTEIKPSDMQNIGPLLQSFFMNLELKR